MRDRLFVIRSLGRFIVRERAWWMAPIVVVLAIVGLLIVTAALTPAAPFVYPLF